MKLNSKKIILTGAGSGMGRELALALLARGAEVIAIDINQTSLDETVELAGTSGKHISIYTLDGMEKDKYRIIVGKDSRFMDLLYRLTPAGAAKMIRKRMQDLLS